MEARVSTGEDKTQTSLYLGEAVRTALDAVAALIYHGNRSRAAEAMLWYALAQHSDSADTLALALRDRETEAILQRVGKAGATV